MTKQNKSRKTILSRIARNDALFDKWSIVHCATGLLMGWLISPVIALALMIIWEPIEIFIISPLVANIGIVFGHETLKNSLSDIVFDAIGIAIGYYLLAEIITPPFQLF